MDERISHKWKEMNLKKLIVRLRIEEDNKSSYKKVFNPNDAKANVVEYGQCSRNKENESEAKT